MSKSKFRYGGSPQDAGGRPVPFVPDYSGWTVVISSAGNTYMVEDYGYIMAVGHNGSSTATKPLIRVKINDLGPLIAMTGRNDTQVYMSSGLFPVAPGDVVELSDGTFSDYNRVFFLAVRT